MATITLHATKGQPLTHAEVDGNFTALNDAVIATDATAAALSATIGQPSGIATLNASGQLAEPSPSEVITESGTSRTLALIDAGKYINCTAGTAVTITIPLNATAAFPISTEIDVWQDGAGVVSFVGAVGVTIHSVGLSLAAQYRAATLKKVGTDTWHIIGPLV